MLSAYNTIQKSKKYSNTSQLTKEELQSLQEASLVKN
jgi:hypothetical protein